MSEMLSKGWVAIELGGSVIYGEGEKPTKAVPGLGVP